MQFGAISGLDWVVGGGGFCASVPAVVGCKGHLGPTGASVGVGASYTHPATAGDGQHHAHK